MYTSIFKSNNVRVTQKFKPGVHNGLDMVCDDTLFAKVYLPTFFGDGDVWKITKGYSYNGKWYADGRIIWVKHPNGKGQRFIHSRDADIQVKVGQHVKVGDWLCRQGDSGPVTGVHLHYDVLNVYNDLNSRVDPLNYISNETMNKYNKGDKIKITSTDKVNLRVLPSKGADGLAQVSPGAVGLILSNVVNADGYLWHFIQFGDFTGWMAVNWSEKTTVNITRVDGSNIADPTVALNRVIAERDSEIKRLNGEIDRIQGELVSATLVISKERSENSKLQEEIEKLKIDREEKLEELTIKYQKEIGELDLQLEQCKASNVGEIKNYSLSEILSALIGKLIGIISGTIKE